MSEHEAKTFLPGLVEKCGLAQERLKADCRELMRKFGAMYPGARMVLFIQVCVWGGRVHGGPREGPEAAIMIKVMCTPARHSRARVPC